ncbi:Endonuclease/exonuclease/phosphatase, partial [Earliella scabrosa]
MLSQLSVVYQNVNRSNAQTSSMLESFASSCDVFCVQEPWHGRLKPVASTADVGPHERVVEGWLYGTVIHPNWQLLVPQYESRVACYVNRRLVNAISRLHASVSHRDCMLLSLTLRADAEPIQILNVYNDVHNEAVRYLHRIIHELPALDCIGGDFNTHSVLWDPEYPSDSAERVHSVTSLFDNLGLTIINTPGAATHYPHGSGRSTVIDLAAVPAGLFIPQLELLYDDMGPSDHVPLRVKLPTTVWALEGAPTIPIRSEEEQKFLEDIRQRSEAISADPITSLVALQERVDQLFAAIAAAWNDHARPRRFSHKSNSWWNNECADAREARDRAHLARRAYLATLRAAKRKFFDERITEVAETRK